MLVLTPLLAHAQENGIHFEQNLTWTQVKAKAKAENKYIFVDCYATWCGPCKIMDREVYPKDTVGKVMNEKFVSVKVQFDSTKLDNEMVTSWYPDVAHIMKDYKITAFPSYLFFSPDGEIVHRDEGVKSKADFVKLTNTAADPTKQFYTLLAQYQKGEKNYAVMPYLANSVKTFLKDKELANRIGQDYLQNYLYKLNEADLYTKENVINIGIYIQSTREKGFSLFYNHADKVDALIRSGSSQNEVDFLITKEEISTKLYKDGKPLIVNPDWKKLSAAISKKYNNSYAERIILNSQIKWYGIKKDWKELAKYTIKKVDIYGLDTLGAMHTAFTNNMIWEVIFEHSVDKAVLNKGIEWMEMIVRYHPDDETELDTYANLQYKAGRVKEAILNEEKAAKLNELKAIKQKRTPDKSFKETLEKMRTGVPTWQVE